MESTWIVSTKIWNYRRKIPDICHVQIKKGIFSMVMEVWGKKSDGRTEKKCRLSLNVLTSHEQYNNIEWCPQETYSQVNFSNIPLQ